MPTLQAGSHVEEIQRLMQADWEGFLGDGKPLADVDRAAQLYGIVEDPYHRVAFAGRSNLALLQLCAHGLIEQRQWDKAARVINNVCRLEREHQRAQALADAPPAPQANSQTEQASRPDILTLSDRDLWLQLKAARRDRRRARGKPVPPAQPVANANLPVRHVANSQSHPPFT